MEPKSRPSTSSLRSHSAHMAPPVPDIPRKHILRSKTADGTPYVPMHRPNPARAATHDWERRADLHQPSHTTLNSAKSKANLREHGTAKERPWQHMSQTYAWVEEQERRKQEKRNKKTEEWVFQQQGFTPEQPQTKGHVPAKEQAGHRAHGDAGGKEREELKKRMWEELMYAYEMEAEKWMRQEEEVRKAAVEREMAKTRATHGDARRAFFEERSREKRDKEKEKDKERKKATERARAQEMAREWERQEQARANQVVADAWRRYEARWAELLATSGPLTFVTIPWPVVHAPKEPSNVTGAGIIMFLFSQAHSSNQSRKDRIKSALLRWHPDRFRRLLGRVDVREKAAVEEGVGIVVRCLNDLMARETRVAQNAGASNVQ